MLFKYGFISLLLAAVCLLVIAGCKGSIQDTADDEISLVSVPSLIGLKSAEVDAIQVFFGDGTRLTLDKEEELDQIMQWVNSLQAYKIEGARGPGFLYAMDMVQGNQKLRLANEFEVEGQWYALSGPEQELLSRYLIEQGRAHNPELLPGITMETPEASGYNYMDYAQSVK
ncbi:hypothetical protein GCM10008915_35050 [Bifidobacterium pullorum subsp. gallinarum]